MWGNTRLHADGRKNREHVPHTQAGAVEDGGAPTWRPSGRGGLALFAWCAVALARGPAVSQTQWLVITVLTFATGRLTSRCRRLQARFSVSEMFAFAAVLLFGPEAGAVTLAIDSLIVSGRHRMTFAQTLFNFGNLALSVWVSGSLFFLAAGTGPLAFEQRRRTTSMILPLALFAATYFVVNSGLIVVWRSG